MSEPTQHEGQGVIAEAGAADGPVAAAPPGATAPAPATAQPPVPAGDGAAHEVPARTRHAPAPWWNHYLGILGERGQEVVSFAVAATLVVLAGGILVAAVVDFFSLSRQDGMEYAATDFLDRVLLVLILVEIVHTVLLSLRAHALVAQPFLVVGLVAVVRKILFALGSQQKVAASTLGVYIGMVAVFVAALIAIQVVEARRHRDATGDESSRRH